MIIAFMLMSLLSSWVTDPIEVEILQQIDQNIVAENSLATTTIIVHSDQCED